MPTIDANSKLVLQNEAYTPQSKGIRFNGASRLTIPDSADWTFGSGNFTIETWARFDSAGYRIMAVHANSDSSYMNFSTNAGYLSFGIVGSSIGLDYVWTDQGINKWNHLAVVRNGTSWSLYVNGKSVMSVTSSTTVPDYSGPWEIGGATYNGTLGLQGPIPGWLRNYRISNIARYTADFTPSNADFTSDGNTLFLMLGNESLGATSFTDSSSFARTITVASGAPVLTLASDFRESRFIDTENTPKTVIPKYDTKIESKLIDSNAMFFNGSQFVFLPDSNEWDFGTGDFTVEAWFNPTSVAQATIIACGDSYSGTGFRLNIDSSTQFEATINATIHTRPINNAQVLQRDCWYHVALVRANNIVNIYLNGIAQGTQAADNNVVTGSTSGVHIGSNHLGSATFFNGWMKEVNVVSYAKYTTTFTPSQTAITPETVTTVKAAKFDGVGDGLTLADHADWDFGTGGNYTIELHARFYSHGAAEQWLVSRTDTTYALRYQNDSFRVDVLNVNRLNVAFTVKDNRWYHLALVRNSGTTNLYVDGLSIGSFADTFDYTSATQLFIGLRTGSTDPFFGWLKNVRLSNSARYTGNFVPPVVSTIFTNDANTKLLISAEESKGVTTFVDSEGSPKTITTVGDTISDIVNADTVNAIAFDGTGDYLSLADSADWQLGGGTGDFTLESWVNFNSVAGTQAFGGQYQDASNYIWWGYNGTDLRFEQQTSPALNLSCTKTFTAGIWYHLALVRSGTVFTYYINGIAHATTLTSSNSVNNITGNYNVGQLGNAGSFFNGFMKQYRVSNVARYTANFTPTKVTVNLVNDSNTKLLLLGGEAVNATTFTDSEGTPKTVTTNGDCRLKTIDSDMDFTKLLIHGTPTTGTMTTNMKSGLSTNETGSDYLTKASGDADFIIGTGDWSMECDIFPSDTAGGAIMACENHGSNYNWFWRLDPGNRISMAVGPGSWASGPSYISDAAKGVVSAQCWSHIRQCRTGNTILMFVNGVNVLSTSIADFSTSNGQVYIGNDGYGTQGRFYIRNLHFVKGTALSTTTATFTPPTTITNVANTKLALKFDDAVNSTSYTDSSAAPKTFTNNGNAKINRIAAPSSWVVDASPATKYVYNGKIDWFAPFGYGVACYDGTNDTINIPTSTDWNFGTGDWTLEGWFRWRGTLADAVGITVQSHSTGIRFSIRDSGGVPGFHIYVVLTEYYTTHGCTPSVNTWHHFAGTRSGNNLFFHINGVKNGNTEDVTGKNITGNTNGVYVGSTEALAAPLNGFTDNVMISNVARYTSASFTPDSFDAASSTAASSPFLAFFFD